MHANVVEFMSTSEKNYLYMRLTFKLFQGLKLKKKYITMFSIRNQNLFKTKNNVINRYRY